MHQHATLFALFFVASAVGESIYINNTMLRCVYSQQRSLSFDCTGERTPQFLRSSSTCSRSPVERDLDPCGFRFIGELNDSWTDGSLFEGLPELHLIGDSTVMRTYMHILNATDYNYTQRVKELNDDELQGLVTTHSGRRVPIYFHRSLHIALAPAVLSAVIATAASRAAVVLAYGPHDTSWLVFRKPMPFFNRKSTGRWAAAEQYWRKYAGRLALAAAVALANRSVDERPVLMVREHFFANCKHPKYAKYPLITRCGDLLIPRVIPTYRMWLQGLFALLNVPTVGLDGLFPPCLMVDAGHIDRKCKALEVQFIAQAYREVRRSRVVQGPSSTDSVKTFASMLFRSSVVAAFTNSTRRFGDAQTMSEDKSAVINESRGASEPEIQTTPSGPYSHTVSRVVVGDSSRTTIPLRQHTRAHVSPDYLLASVGLLAVMIALRARF